MKRVSVKVCMVATILRKVRFTRSIDRKSVRMVRRQVSITLACLGVFMVSGCVQIKEGSVSLPEKLPSVDISVSNMETENGGVNKLPAIIYPLNADKFAADPCVSLTSGQLASFDITGLAFRKENTCSWKL